MEKLKPMNYDKFKLLNEVIVEQEAPAFRFHPAVPVMIPDDSTAVAITFPGGVTCTITGKGAAHE